jgi:hypothetical protein
MSTARLGTRYLAVVARDRPAVFHGLKAQLEEPGHVEVIWDRRGAPRRRGERRKRRASTPGRRQRERRSRPPETWTTLGFVMVPQPKRTRRARVWAGR